MNTLVNESVEHIKFGKGKIIGEELCRLKVVFDKGFGTKCFPYPDAFEKFLKLENETLQDEYFVLAVNKRESLAKEMLELRKEHEYMDKEDKKKKLELTKKKRTTSSKTK